MSEGSWVAIAVAAIAAAGGWLHSRWGRVARLERENRQLWWVCKGLIHTLYTNGIEPDAELVELINGKDKPA